MTNWLPEIDEDDSLPRYRAIADAIARDIHSGLLGPGDRLPTHRVLADHLGVTVGTVTRGYVESARRGLTVGEVGRGTFVRSDETDHWAEVELAGSTGFDLSMSLPPILEGELDLFSETLRQIAADPKSHSLLHYQPGTATPRQREAGAVWIAKTGLTPLAQDLLVTAGSQHGMAVTIGTLLRPGDVLITGDLTYPGVKSAAHLSGVRLRGVAVDDEGLIPEAVDEACQIDPRPRALYVVPTIQNPTGGVMSLERRLAIAAVAQKHDLILVEDDVHAFLVSEPMAPIATIAPERTVYLHSMGKALNLGLRTGFIVAPPPWRDRLRAGIRSTMWMAPPLTVELATRWIDSGVADDLVERKRIETSRRQAVMRDALAGFEFDGHPHALHLWLHLPEPWRSEDLVGRARQRGVLIAGAEVFAVGRREVPHAVRLCHGEVRDIPTLRRGLDILLGILTGDRDPYVMAP